MNILLNIAIRIILFIIWPVIVIIAFGLITFILLVVLCVIILALLVMWFGILFSDIKLKKWEEIK